MAKTLTLDQQVWVDNTLGSMTLEECVGQLLMPDARARRPEDWPDLLREAPLGGVFVDDRDEARLGRTLDAVQSHSRVPVAVAADMEAGVAGGTGFPSAMALGAAGDRALARARGRVLAREARARGVHCAFQPVADILYNFRNPETGPRAFGDKPARVRALVVAEVAGLQEEGLLAATVRHFPGAGLDDRDARWCTTANPFPMGKWRRTYGSVWRAAIDAGVMAVMTGPLALPDCEDLADRPSEALPAPLSPRLQIDLLRGELGFAGVIVSAPATVGGLAVRAEPDELAVRFILAGGDVLLFAEPRLDFARLLRAVRDGRLTEARVRESARRVLELKARVGLHRGLKVAAPTAAERTAHQAQAQEIADRATTLWKNDGLLPVRLAAGARVLTVTFRADARAGVPAPELDVVDDELRRRGYAVDHRLNPDGAAFAAAAADCDLVCVNVAHLPASSLGPGGGAERPGAAGWRGLRPPRRNAVFTAFGSPFVIYEAPPWPNVVLAYGDCDACQRAAVKVWLGELEPRGVLPVTLPRF